MLGLIFWIIASFFYFKIVLPIAFDDVTVLTVPVMAVVMGLIFQTLAATYNQTINSIGNYGDEAAQKFLKLTNQKLLQFLVVAVIIERVIVSIFSRDLAYEMGFVVERDFLPFLFFVLIVAFPFYLHQTLFYNRVKNYKSGKEYPYFINRAIKLLTTKPESVTSIKPSNNPPKYTLAIVCFFLGWLGVHRFIIGRVKTGIFMLFMPVLAPVFFASPQAFLLMLQTFIDDSMFRDNDWVRVHVFKALGMFFFGIVISLIWALIDFLIIITGNFKDKNGNKIKQ